MQLTVNGIVHHVEEGLDRPLLDYLRETLGLTGAKAGCRIGVCGACTVLVDGRPRPSCRLPLRRLAGAEMVTIEGEAVAPELPAIRRAFLDAGAVQCGFCTPGMILSTLALLRENPNPDDRAIRRALDRNLCRCTGYGRIVEAVRLAAGRTAGQQPPAGVCPRPDAGDKATGRALYAEDLRPRSVLDGVTTPPAPREGWLHGALARAGQVYARLTALHTDAAERAPGVERLLTARDVPGAACFGRARMDQPVFVDEVARFEADALALVLARTEAEARAAARLVRADWVPLPPVTDPVAALAPTAPRLYPEGNLAAECVIDSPGSSGDAAGPGRAASAIGRYSTAWIEHACLEPEAAAAWPDDKGGLTVYGPSQNVFFDRKIIAEVLGVPVSTVRVIQAFTGGAFGKREDLYASLYAALGAWLTRRPVSIAWTREETLQATTKRHPMDIEIETDLDEQGAMASERIEVLADTGPYLSWAPNIMRKAAVHVAGPYRRGPTHIRVRAAHTNNANAGAMRGYGATQVIFAREMHMDALARRVGADPLSYRLDRLLREGEVTATGQAVDARILREAAERAAARFGWKAFRRERGDGLLHGRGMALSMYGIGYGNGIPDIGSASVELLENGRIELRTGAVDYGQGALAVFARIAAEALDCPADRFDIVTGDTAETPDSGSTVASRQTTVTGQAVRKASDKLAEAMARAGRAPGEPIAAGLFSAMRTAGAPVRHQGRFKLATERIDASGQGAVYAGYAMGCQMAEVAVDPGRKRTIVSRMVAVHDVGRILREAEIIGQIEGGIAMGLGMALSERYRMEAGRSLDRNFDTYRIPRASDMPVMEIELLESGSGPGPYGAIGIGEPAMLPTAPAILNAINDALGLDLTSLPARLDTIPRAEQVVEGPVSPGPRA